MIFRTTALRIATAILAAGLALPVVASATATTYGGPSATTYDTDYFHTTQYIPRNYNNVFHPSGYWYEAYYQGSGGGIYQDTLDTANPIQLGSSGPGRRAWCVNIDPTAQAPDNRQYPVTCNTTA